MQLSTTSACPFAREKHVIAMFLFAFYTPLRDDLVVLSDMAIPSLGLVTVITYSCP